MKKTRKTAVTDDRGSACGVGREGIKCAVIAWVAPLLAAMVLLAGLYYPVVSVFNILLVAFGITAVLRSVAHIRRYGSCGLGAHVSLGVLLNVVVVILIAVYFFTALDPLGIRSA